MYKKGFVKIEMYLGKKIIVVLPAWNAENTLEKTINNINEPNRFAI